MRRNKRVRYVCSYKILQATLLHPSIVDSSLHRIVYQVYIAADTQRLQSVLFDDDEGFVTWS
jgi:hypothetical protein